jgi:hypothetical protein
LFDRIDKEALAMRQARDAETGDYRLHGLNADIPRMAGMGGSGRCAYSVERLKCLHLGDFSEQVSNSALAANVNLDPL